MELETYRPPRLNSWKTNAGCNLQKHPGDHPSGNPGSRRYDEGRHAVSAETKGRLVGARVAFVGRCGEVFKWGYLPLEAGEYLSEEPFCMYVPRTLRLAGVDTV